MRDALSQMLVDQFWKHHQLDKETPRKGDLAAVVKDHHARETGLLVRVTNDPIFGTIYCDECGARIDDVVVEIELVDHLGRALEGEHLSAYPSKWLQRILPIGHADASQKQVVTSGR
jgi:hypothetical protein